jgi:hypothetical protein
VIALAQEPTRRVGRRRVFFSEEKKQKTFISGAHGKIPAPSLTIGASMVEAAKA